MAKEQHPVSWLHGLFDKSLTAKEWVEIEINLCTSTFVKKKKIIACLQLTTAGFKNGFFQISCRPPFGKEGW